jgi:hypothetical protein
MCSPSVHLNFCLDAEKKKKHREKLGYSTILWLQNENISTISHTYWMLLELYIYMIYINNKYTYI